MKTHLSVILLLWMGVALTQAASTSVVVPNALANVEGNSSMSDVFNSSSFRMQMVFNSSQFAFLGTTSFARIDSISFRPDGVSTFDVLYGFGGSAIQLSTTSRSADSLSPVFADNIGANVVTIYNGGVGFGGVYQPGASPQPFNQNILVATGPFFYVPSQGNLLLDIRAVSGQVLFPGYLDAEAAGGDSVSRVFALSNLASSGTADSLGLVAQFNITVIPEPSVLALGMIGCVATFLLRRKN